MRAGQMLCICVRWCSSSSWTHERWKEKRDRDADREREKRQREIKGKKSKKSRKTEKIINQKDTERDKGNVDVL